MKVLFICTGNTCRSPMAEALFLKVAGKGHTAFSRGLAVGQTTVSPHAVKVMKEYEADIEEHTAKPLTEADLTEADLVLTMTKAHKRMIFSLYPGFKEKIFTLSEYVGEEGDVHDPFGGGSDEYAECARQLHDLVSRILP